MGSIAICSHYEMYLLALLSSCSSSGSFPCSLYSSLHLILSFSLSVETLDTAIWMSDRQNRYKARQWQVSTLRECFQSLYKEYDSVEWWAETDCYISTAVPKKIQYNCVIVLQYYFKREIHWESHYCIPGHLPKLAPRKNYNIKVTKNTINVQCSD